MKKFVNIAAASLMLLSASALMAGGGGSSAPLAGSHPIVLSHGILGFDDSQSAPFIKYWGGMDDYLRSQGAPVLTPGSTALTSVEDRAAEQKGKILQWMAANGYSKVNVLGHSQGGLVSRYMVSNLGMTNKVSSITSINTPHYGAPLADISLAVVPNWLEPFANDVLSFFAGLIYSDNTQDVIAMAESLTVANANAFNANTPNRSGVDYFSYGSYAYVDIIQHPIMSLTLPITFIGGPIYGFSTYNDGVVPYDSQKWGTFKGRPDDYWFATGLDHLQVTNFEWTGQNYFDVEGFYLQMAQNAMSAQ